MELAKVRFNLGDTVTFYRRLKYSKQDKRTGVIRAIHYTEHKSDKLHFFSVSYLVAYAKTTSGKYDVSMYINDRHYVITRR